MNIDSHGRLTLADAKYVDGAIGDRVTEGDVIFNNTNSVKLVGKTAYVGREGDGLAYSNHMTRLRVDQKTLEPKFLALYLQFKFESGEFESICSRHVNQASIGTRIIFRQLVPTPALVEQRRIVELLDEALSKVDRTEYYLDAAMTRTRSLAESYLANLFGTVEGSPSKLGALAAWSAGGTPKAKNPKYYLGGTIPWCNSGDLNNGHILDVPKKITELGLAESTAKWVPENSVLIAMYGATIGRCAINDIPLTTNQAVATAVPDTTLVSTEYLFWLVRSESRRLRQAGRGGAQSNINQMILKDWTISLPDRETQARLVKEANEFETKNRSLLGEMQVLRNRSQPLRRAVFEAAFSGRLTGHRVDAEIIEEIAST